MRSAIHIGMIELDVKGVKEAIANLEDLDRKIQRKILMQGLRAGGKAVLPIAKQLAPTKSGALQKNIKVRSGGIRRGNARIYVGLNQKGFTGKTWYGAAIIYGHRTRGVLKRGRVGYAATGTVAPNDFLQRAAAQGATAAIEATAAKWAELIEQEGSKV